MGHSFSAFSRLIVLGRSILVTPFLLQVLGCSLSQKEFCNDSLPRLQADLGGQQNWVAQQRILLQQGRGLASISVQANPGVLGLFQKSEAELLAEERVALREGAQGWAIERLTLVQRAQDTLEQGDRHDVLPLLGKLNNELVSYFGYSEDLNWERMQRRLQEMQSLTDEVAHRVCSGG